MKTTPFLSNSCIVCVENGTMFIKMPSGEPIPLQADLKIDAPVDGLVTATVTLFVRLEETVDLPEPEKIDSNKAYNEARSKLGLGPILDGECYNVTTNGVPMTGNEFKELGYLNILKSGFVD